MRYYFEKRKYDRADSFKSKILISKTNFPVQEVVCNNISCGGMEIVYDVNQLPLTTKDPVTIKLSLWLDEARFSEIDISCQMRWSDGAGKAGLAFKDLPDKYFEALRSTIQLSEISESSKIEYQQRVTEIRQYADSAFRINTGVIALTVTLLGVLNLFKIESNSENYSQKFIYLLPLVGIFLGFKLYENELKKIRRIGMYMRFFMEPKLGISWEEDLYRFRRLGHTLTGNNSYHLGYYFTALWLGFFTFLSGLLLNLSDFKAFLYGKGPVPVLSVVFISVFVASCFIWSAILAKIKQKNKENEGADKEDADMALLWKRVYWKEKGICQNEAHQKELIKILRKKDVDEKAIKEYSNKFGGISCSHECFMKGTLQELVTLLDKSPSISERQWRWHIRILAPVTTFLIFIFLLWAAYYLFLHNPIIFPWYAVTCLFFIFVLSQVRVVVKKIYCKKEKGNQLVNLQALAYKISHEQGLFPRNYVTFKEISWLRWITFYKWNKEWSAQKGKTYVLALDLLYLFAP